MPSRSAGPRRWRAAGAAREPDGRRICARGRPREAGFEVRSASRTGRTGTTVRNMLSFVPREMMSSATTSSTATPGTSSSRKLAATGSSKLLAATIVIVGAGGIGSPAIQYLAAAGVGALRVIDDDSVALDNLQRQTPVRHRRRRPAQGRGRRRSGRAAQSRRALRRRAARLDRDNVAALLAGADVVLDGSDNFATRLAVSDHCTAAAHSAGLGGDRPVPGPDRHLSRLGAGQALLSLLRRRRLRRRGLRQLRRTGRARRDGRHRRQPGRRWRRSARCSASASDPAGKLHIFDGLAPAMRTIRIVKDPACRGCGGSGAEQAAAPGRRAQGRVRLGREGKAEADDQADRAGISSSAGGRAAKGRVRTARPRPD